MNSTTRWVEHADGTLTKKYGHVMEIEIGKVLGNNEYYMYVHTLKGPNRGLSRQLHPTPERAKEHADQLGKEAMRFILNQTTHVLGLEPYVQKILKLAHWQELHGNKHPPQYLDYPPLEWLVDKSKEDLLGIRGLGKKSVEAIEFSLHICELELMDEEKHGFPCCSHDISCL